MVDVCYVVNAVGDGSIPADIARGVTAHTNHSVDIVTWFDSDGFEKQDTLDVIDLDAPDTTTGLDRRTYERAKETLSPYDVVQAHHNHSGAYAKILARRLGIPSVSREGNTRDGFTRKGRIANGVTNTLADRIVCISESVYRSFRRWERLLVDEQAVEIIPNGVHLDEIDAIRHEQNTILADLSVAEDAHLVGHAGMLYEQKAQDVLIEAIAQLNERVSAPVELLICGGGPERERLERLGRELGVAEQIHFMGLVSRNDVYRMMDAVDAYAMPSRWEGFCVAVAEALATKTPTVLSDIDTFQELYGETALYHPVDDIDGLVDQLHTVLTDEQTRARLSRDGYELVRDEYSIETVAKRYGSIYKAIV